MLRVTYSRASDLQRDLDGQLCHGGLLVQAAPPPGLALGDPATLEIVAPDGTVLRGEGQVLHVLPGGVAVTFPAAEIERLRALAASCADAPGAGPPRHEIVQAAAPSGRSPRPAAGAGEARRIEGMTTPEKIQVVLHGSREERAAILRDRARIVHPYVLKNPQITPDEVAAIAKSGLSSPEILAQIGEKREWLGRPAIALGLARNPKTPPAMGIRALDHIPPADLRQIAKGNQAPPHVTEAAKRKVIKP